MEHFKPIFYHVLFWALFTVAFGISEWGYEQSFNESLNYHLLLLPGRLITVYINWFLLIPLFLYKNKRIQYLISLLIVLSIAAIAHRYFVLNWGYPTYFSSWVEEEHLDHIWKPSRLIQYMLAFFFPVAITSLFRIFKNWYNHRKLAEELKKEKVEAELKFLKSQTNPHFLFNTLNSIYGLALEKSNKTPALILKLSEILNYTLYESNVEKVPLRKELNLIQNIIGLEKERYGKRVAIKYEEKLNIDNVLIPPLVLVPFVENAFKHGMRNETRKGWIEIEINTTEHAMEFKIENSYIEEKKPSKGSGIGLKNVSRRLELIYGNNKDLTIREEGDSFLVILNLKLYQDEN